MGENSLSGDDFAAAAAEAVQAVTKALGDLITIRTNALAARDILRCAPPHGIAHRAFLALEGATAADIADEADGFTDLLLDRAAPYDLYRVGWENGWCEGLKAGQERSRSLTSGERDAVLNDLGELLEVLGMDDYARPESPHEVMQLCITQVGLIMKYVPQAA